MKHVWAIFFIAFFIATPALAGEGATDNSPDWFFPKWAAEAPNNKPIKVLDTEAPLGRYALKTKEIGLKDLARIHGHLCDGLAFAFVAIREALLKLFPDGVVDRTDIRVVTRNSPCFVDAATLMTGARINFMTVRVDNSLGWEFIVQKISTGETYRVRLKQGFIPRDFEELEKEIRARRKKGLPVSAKEIDHYEELLSAFIHKLLYTPPERFVIVERLPHYEFHFLDLFGPRGDTIDKNMPRRDP